MKSEWLKLVKELDDVFSLYIRKKYKFKCWFKGRDKVRCSKTMQNNHIIGRGNYTTRWLERNCKCGCSGHNTYYHFNEPELHALIAKEEPELWEYLSQIRHMHVKRTREDLRLMILEFKSKIKDME